MNGPKGKPGLVRHVVRLLRLLQLQRGKTGCCPVVWIDVSFPESIFKCSSYTLLKLLNRLIFTKFKCMTHRLRRWCSGIMQDSHSCDPGSIPGRRTNFAFPFLQYSTDAGYYRISIGLKDANSPFLKLNAQMRLYLLRTSASSYNAEFWHCDSKKKHSVCVELDAPTTLFAGRGKV